jgi:hypothetical protein
VRALGGAGEDVVVVAIGEVDKVADGEALGGVWDASAPGGEVVGLDLDEAEGERVGEV